MTTLACFFKLYRKNSKTKLMIMKKVLLAFTIAATFAACTGKTHETAVVVVDTTAIKNQAILNEQARVKAEADERNRLAAVAAANRRSSSSNRSSASNSGNVGTTANPSSTGSGTVTQVPAKRGMSSAAKGAIIGGAGGAIAGGIIGKNVKGALIGAAAGAGGGYIIGRSKDRKTGRVQ
jgi:hypothetical protein